MGQDGGHRSPGRRRGLSAQSVRLAVPGRGVSRRAALFAATRPELHEIRHLRQGRGELHRRNAALPDLDEQHGGGLAGGGSSERHRPDRKVPAQGSVESLFRRAYRSRRPDGPRSQGRVHRGHRESGRAHQLVRGVHVPLDAGPVGLRPGELLRRGVRRGDRHRQVQGRTHARRGTHLQSRKGVQLPYRHAPRTRHYLRAVDARTVSRRPERRARGR